MKLAQPSPSESTCPVAKDFLISSHAVEKLFDVCGNFTDILTFAALRVPSDSTIVVPDLVILKLKLVFERTISLIEEYNPDEIAIEAPFFGKNIQSMLKLGRAQGVSMAAGLSREIPITEYSPKKIKMAITGNGNASKEQVAKMLQQLMKIKTLPKNLDATDGLAAAVCHYYNMGKLNAKKSYTGWSAYVNQNPKKINS